MVRVSLDVSVDKQSHSGGAQRLDPHDQINYCAFTRSQEEAMKEEIDCYLDRCPEA